MKHNYTEDQRKEIALGYANSNITTEEYSKQFQISRRTLYLWRKKYEAKIVKSESKENKMESNQFVDVKPLLDNDVKPKTKLIKIWLSEHTYIKTKLSDLKDIVRALND